VTSQLADKKSQPFADFDSAFNGGDAAPVANGADFKKSQSVNIFKRVDDPFDDEFFLDEDADGATPPPPSQSQQPPPSSSPPPAADAAAAAAAQVGAGSKNLRPTADAVRRPRPSIGDCRSPLLRLEFINFDGRLIGRIAGNYLHRFCNLVHPVGSGFPSKPSFVFFSVSVAHFWRFV